MNCEEEFCPDEDPEQGVTAARSQETEHSSPLNSSTNHRSLQETHCFCFSAENARICKHVSVIKDIIISVLIILVITLIAGLIKMTRNEQQSCALVSAAQCSPPCPHQWIGYEGKCYFLSKEKRNWTSSQEFCSALNASLASVEREEKDFVMSIKDEGTYWIDDRKKPVDMEESDCFYLDNERSSSGCHAELPCICSKAARC